MYEYLQFAAIVLCRKTEKPKQELAFIIPNPLFEFE